MAVAKIVNSLPTPYAMPQGGSVDGLTLFKNKSEALATLTYVETPSTRPPYTPIVITNRFIGQEIMLQEFDPAYPADNGQFPAKYWFKEGISNEEDYLVRCDLYNWVFLNP